MIYRDQAELEDAVRYWRSVLSLRDWTVKATFARYYEMDEAGRNGECKVDEAHRFIRIWIIQSSDYPESAVFAHDQELTLVHELLHVHYAAVQPDDDDERGVVCMEQSINAIAAGLVRLRRSQEGR